MRPDSDPQSQKGMVTDPAQIVDVGRGYPEYMVGADPWRSQPSLCERSFVSKRSSGVYQQVLDDEMKFLCYVTPALKDSSDWSIAYDSSVAERMPVFTTDPPEGSQTEKEEGLDFLRLQACQQMDALRNKNVPFADLCGGSLFSSGYDFSSPTISSSDVAPYCGIEMAKMCSSQIGDRFMNNDTTEMEQDCALAAWNAACFAYSTNEDYYIPNKNDVGYNQLALGLLPFWCACSCWNACTASGH
jgi:hypothetical protein